MSSAAVVEAMPTSGVSPQAQSSEYVLEVVDVRKEFPGVLALDNVQLKIRPGTVHALMGENGAGKSTLMKVIAGIYQPDQGEVRLRGEPVTLETPLKAQESGVAMIHQELLLMNSMTVSENIWIRREPRNSFGLIDHDRMRGMTVELFDRLNIRLNPDAEISTLSVANRQMVEIAKAVSFNSDVLIMDEPTSAITETEVAHLFEIIRDLRKRGIGIVYITHKMNELFEIADEFSVFRDGKYIGTHLSSEVTRDDIIKMMVGREVSQMFPKEEVEIGDVLLSVKNLSLEGVFHDISFDVRKGEILGLAGLVGAGRSNVAETIFGVTPATSGQIFIEGEEVNIKNPHDAIRQGMAFLTEDRKETGCFLPLDIQENVQSAVLHDNYVNNGFVDHAALEKESAELCKKLRVKTPSMHEVIENLSGGNQQKVLIARWLLTHPRILILDEPTRGIDVGAKSEIHALISQLAHKGVAVIMISSELPEVLGMSDRVLVMHEGRCTGILDRDEADQVSVMSLAAK
ncbi:MAG: D-xylose ABC transporter ATP-binding protein [Marinomonas sp.]|jgi:inositol transport system ATP-binding protein|uniref:Ribose/galactose/methyl galactoside import ATP-binding protein n=1 Tax=Marinomonas communis TaxID=28254 RepID=A0A4R6XAJ8_9GAMM|nr:sugar ABC transporter ATP-binding protein [Marinomonas communis]MAF16353.1 D-xylose ABC transporter ATP-binding protein [Marinomonas sp.]TDR12548.1 monosaccharide ABC transporter ATP-binding protein (CUT2 family) [Marinomonas communis]